MTRSRNPDFADKGVVVVELNEVVNAADGNKDFSGNADHGEDEEERNGGDAAVPAVSNAQRQAEMLPFVMHHMHGPKDAPSVMQPVEPVKAKVPEHQGHHKLNRGMQIVHQRKTEPRMHGVKHRDLQPSEQPQNGVA